MPYMIQFSAKHWQSKHWQFFEIFSKFLKNSLHHKGYIDVTNVGENLEILELDVRGPTIKASEVVTNVRHKYLG